MSGDMVNLRKDLSDLSESVGRQIKQLKEMMSSFLTAEKFPREAREKGKRGCLVELNMGHHLTRPAHTIRSSKSWDGMCEYDGDSHRKQRLARPAIANDNSTTSVLEGTDVY
jgi:hypothetical protein